jgi:hypothetical protein
MGFEAVSLLTPKSAPQAGSNASSPEIKTVAAQGRDALSASSETASSLKLANSASTGQSLREISIASEKAKSPAQSRLALMEAISQLKPDELERMLAKEAGDTDLYRSARFDFQFAAKRLSEIAPEKAAALWLKTKSTHFGVDALLLPWAKKDPQAFASWGSSLPPDAQRAMAGTLGQLVAETPERFSGIAAQLTNSPAGIVGARSAISGMISRAQKGTDPGEAIAYAQALPEGPVRTTALAEMARWPGFNLAEHPEVAAAVSSLSISEARRYLPQITGVADALPPGPVRDAAFANQFTATAKKDPQAAAKRVDALVGTPDYAPAVRGFVEATAAKDPAAAIEWALTLGTQGSQSAQRAAALEKAAAEYFRTKPADARKWVQTAPLTPAEYQMLTGQPR